MPGANSKTRPAHPAPEPRHLIHGVRIRLGRGSHHAGRAFEQIGARGRDAHLLGAGHGMTADEPHAPGGAQRGQLGHHAGLGAAHVGDNRPGRQGRQQPFQ